MIESMSRKHGLKQEVTVVLRHNLHVLLDEDLHRRLHSAATRKQRPATTLARDAIRRWVEEEERAVRHAGIAAYAAASAGTGDDLDPELEASAVEHLLDGRSPDAVRDRPSPGRKR
jgi:predicted transcriptional regulator